MERNTWKERENHIHYTYVQSVTEDRKGVLAACYQYPKIYKGSKKFRHRIKDFTSLTSFKTSKSDFSRYPLFDLSRCLNRMNSRLTCRISNPVSAFRKISIIYKGTRIRTV